MKMNKRQIKLLKNLMMQEDYIAVKFFSDLLETSGKTISKDLDDIEAELQFCKVKILRKQNAGVKLNLEASQMEQINAYLNTKQILGEYDVEYRRIQILLNLLINTNKYITVQKLSDKYLVSRTSIANDFVEIEKKLKKYNLELIKTSKGTKLKGNEINIRKALVANVQEHGKIVPNYKLEYQEIRHSELNLTEINTLLTEGSTDFFEKLLNKLENKLDMVIYEPYYTNLLTHLVIMTTRIIDGNHIQEAFDINTEISLENKNLYKSAEYLINQIETHFDISINTAETSYIYKYLSSIGLGYETNVLEGEAELEKLPIYFTKELIAVVSEMTNIDFNSKLGLYSRLTLHIKPMLNRLKYMIQITNPLLKDFLEEFEREFIITKIACYIVCKKYKLNMISEHEVAYILSYFISESEKYTKADILKTVVVCHSGYGTSQLLATRIKKAFVDIEVVDIISSNSMQHIDWSDIDLIISTVNLDTNYPYLTVSAFLSDIDKKNINAYIADRKLSKNTSITHINQTIDMVSIENLPNLEIEAMEKVSINISNKSDLYIRNDVENRIEVFTNQKNEQKTYILTFRDYSQLTELIDKYLSEENKYDR